MGVSRSTDQSVLPQQCTPKKASPGSRAAVMVSVIRLITSSREICMKGRPQAGQRRLIKKDDRLTAGFPDFGHLPGGF